MATSNIDRRNLLIGSLVGGMSAFLPAKSAGALAVPAQPGGSSRPQAPLSVTLLGTGSPELRMHRFGASTLVEAGPYRFVFDAGRGCALRLGQLGIALGTIDAVFLTHFHSDHLNGFQDLWATSFIRAPYAGRTDPLALYGPVGTAAIAESMRAAMAPDIAIREADEKVDPDATAIDTHEFAADGVIFDADGVRVTAFAVDHGDLVKPSYGYRVDHRGRSVTLSGDTRPSDNLIAHARGTDLLIHEVCMLSPGMESDPRAARIMAHHTSPTQAGEVFAQARPKLAVFSHVGQIAWPGFAPVTDAMILAATKTSYDGRVLVGRDLDRFAIDDRISSAYLGQG